MYIYILVFQLKNTKELNWKHLNINHFSDVKKKKEWHSVLIENGDFQFDKNYIF